MSWTVAKDFRFAAAHQIRGHRGGCENLHGHSYRVRVWVRAERLDGLGMVIDFADLKRVMEEVCGPFDHRFLNEVPPLDERNTTAELLARRFHVSEATIRRDGDFAKAVDRVAGICGAEAKALILSGEAGWTHDSVVRSARQEDDVLKSIDWAKGPDRRPEPPAAGKPGDAEKDATASESPASSGGTEAVPGALMRLGVRTPGERSVDLHSASFRADERALEVGLLAGMASLLAI